VRFGTGDAVEKGILELIDRIVETKSPTVIKAIESKIEKLEREKFAIAEKAISRCRIRANFKSVLNSPYDSSQAHGIYIQKWEPCGSPNGAETGFFSAAVIHP